MTRSKYLLLLITLIFTTIMSCKKERILKNPHDENVPKSVWSPKNFNYHFINENGIELRWRHNDDRIDGFTLTKTVHYDDSVYNKTEQLAPDFNTYRDLFVLNSNRTESCTRVQYTLTAFLGDKESETASTENLNFPVPIADAGKNFINHSDSIIRLQADSLAEGLTGRWSIESGNGGVIEDLENPKSIFRVKNFNEVYVLRWTVSDECSSSHDDIWVTMSASNLM